MGNAWHSFQRRMWRESRAGMMARRRTSGSFRRTEAQFKNSGDFAREFSTWPGPQTGSISRPILVELITTFGKYRLRIRARHASSPLDKPTKTVPRYQRTDDGLSTRTIARAQQLSSFAI